MLGKVHFYHGEASLELSMADLSFTELQLSIVHEEGVRSAPSTAMALKRAFS